MRRMCLNTSGPGIARTIPINTDIAGNCKCITTRQGRLGWENYLGRMEHGGWDCQMTSIIEVYEETDELPGRDMSDLAGDLLQDRLLQRDPEGLPGRD